MVRAIRMKAIRLPCNGSTEKEPWAKSVALWATEASAATQSAMPWGIPAQPFTRTLAFALVRNLRPQWN